MRDVGNCVEEQVKKAERESGLSALQVKWSAGQGKMEVKSAG